MIQGVGVHASGWLPQLPALTPHFTCLTFDNRGLGKSQPIGAKITLPQLAGDTLALMDAQGWESAHLMGHSMGGLIAQEVALTARRRVKSLSLICTFARGKDASGLTPAKFWIGMRTWVGPAASRRRAFLELTLPKGQLPDDCGPLAEHLARYFGHDLANHPPVSMKQLSAISAHNVTPRLGELAGIPTLVISAQYDRLAPPASGKSIAAGIPGARYMEIADQAHGAPMLRADEVSQHLLTHLMSIAPGPTRGS